MCIKVIKIRLKTHSNQGVINFIIEYIPSCRIHAEFQLNEVPNFPFWFTPGQFTGNIVLSKDASHVRQFHLYVPNNRYVCSLSLLLDVSMSVTQRDLSHSQVSKRGHGVVVRRQREQQHGG